jgi:hypothetical protein
MADSPHAFRVKTEGDKETGAIKLTLGGRSHGTFRDTEELLRYAARIKTGLIVLIPGVTVMPASLTLVSTDIKNQVNNLKKMGFK